MTADAESSPPRDRLYETMLDEELEVRERMRRSLSAGREYLGVESGHVQRRDDGRTDEVVASVGPDPDLLPEGTTLDRAKTYCRRTVQSESPVALTDAPNEGWSDDPAYERHGLDCYLGATIYDRGAVYGTVCFASRESRPEQFDDEETMFVELVARLMGRAVESRSFRQTVAESERARQSSEQKYGALVETAPNAIFVADAETGAVVETNERARELTGRTAAELDGMSVLDLHPEQHRERYRDLLESADLESRDRFDDGTPLRIRRADGTDVPVALSADEFEFDGQRYLQSVVQDITERRERETALRRNRELFERTQEIADVGGWEVDLRSGELRMTDELYRILGYDADEDVSVETVYDRVHPADRADLEAACERLAAEGESYDTEVRVRHDDGTVRWTKAVGTAEHGADGDPVVAQGVFQDVTDRRRREEELRTRTRAVEAVPAGITVADADGDQPLTYVNPGFERITGYDRETAVGRNCRFLQGPDTEEAAVDAVREATEVEEPRTTELLNYRADGTPFWNELTVAPVSDGSGSVTHFVGIQRDVTVRKRRERLFGVLNRVLRHNMRNDLGVVEGYGELVRDRADGETAEMAERIVDSARDLLAVSEKARKLDRAIESSASPRVRDVAEDAETVVDSLRADYPEVAFTVRTVDECEVYATRQIRLALRELVDNAARHGESTVDCEVDRDDDGVTVRVHDDGPGLDEYERQVLDEGRETPLRHGSGLGLWLVNWAVTGANGTVTADADGEEGTAITVRLPSVADEAETALDPERSTAVSTFL